MFSSGYVEKLKGVVTKLRVEYPAYKEARTLDDGVKPPPVTSMHPKVEKAVLVEKAARHRFNRNQQT